jgi:hypothetical protein
MIKTKNMQSRAYPDAGPNTTRGVASTQRRTAMAEPGRKSVNVATGPRTGNAGNMDKRRAFMADKSEAAPLAKVIQNAYAARNLPDYVDPRMEGIMPNVKPQKRSR